MTLTEVKKDDMDMAEKANDAGKSVDSSEGIAYAHSGAKEFYDRYPTYDSTSTAMPYYSNIL